MAAAVIMVRRSGWSREAHPLPLTAAIIAQQRNSVVVVVIVVNVVAPPHTPASQSPCAYN